MSEAFIHTCHVEGDWPARDRHFVLSALIGETLAVYYWSEWFMDKRRSQRRSFCVIGQRGLSEYVAKITPKVIAHVSQKADDLQESWGYKFGLAVSLREALRLRRAGEVKRPEYMDQCNASTYRAKKQMHKNYRVSVKDQPVEFDIEGFRRGRKQAWTLTQFKTPIQVLDNYARKL